MKKIIFGLSLLLLTSCGSSKLNDKAVQVEPGMSKEQVLNLMGSPGDRQFQNASEAWQYCSTGVTGNDKHYIIWFEDGYVSGLTSYSEGSTMQCSESFKPIDWRKKPHHKKPRPGGKPPRHK